MKHRSDLTKNSAFPSTFPNALMEYMAPQCSPNFQVGTPSVTPWGGGVVQVAAATGDGQVAVGIMGRWRYNTATVQAAVPGSNPTGVFDVFVTATDNDFSLADPNDATNYAFGLQVLATGSVPTTPLYRKVASLYMAGSYGIQWIKHTVVGTAVDRSLPLYNPGNSSAVSLGLTPIGGYDGMEILYQPVAASAAMWHLRYVAGLANLAHPGGQANTMQANWVVLAGAPIFAYATTDSESTTSGSGVNLSGPSIGLPVHGQYDLDFSLKAYNSDTTRTAIAMAGWNLGVSQTFTAFASMNSALGAWYSNLRLRARFTSYFLGQAGGNTSQTVVSGYQTDLSGTSYFAQRIMSVMPVRLAG